MPIAPPPDEGVDPVRAGAGATRRFLLVVRAHVDGGAGQRDRRNSPQTAVEIRFANAACGWGTKVSV